jgi:hypothetical protein
MRAEVSAEVAAGPRTRETVPAVRERYDIASVAGRVDDLYERLLGQRARRPEQTLTPTRIAITSAAEGEE